MRAALLAVSILLAPLALGELAPEVYKAMQDAAPEVLMIQVLDVDIDRDFHKPDGCGFFEFEIERHVTVQAKVLGVTRSRAGVRPGAVISIKYVSFKRCEGFNGPRPIPVLAEGTRTWAWLAKSNNGFEPAARGASFSIDPSR